MLRDLQDEYRDSASPRCAKCGWLVLSDLGIAVMKRRGRAHLDNIMRCGLVHECPTCQAHIKAERAQEATAVLAWHVGEMLRRTAGTGWNLKRRQQWAESTAVMITLTVRHGFGNDLAVLRKGVADAWKRFQQSDWPKLKAALGLVGMVRALEVTYGDDHGWHPHLHVAAFFDRPPGCGRELEVGHDATSCAKCEAFRGMIFRRWREAVVTKLGLDHAPIEFVYPGGDLTKPKPVGVVVTPCSQANYLAKLGLEISAPNTKAAKDGHVTPLDMLDFFARNQSAGRKKVREFATIGDTELDYVLDDGPRSGDLSLRDEADNHFDAARGWLKLYRNYCASMRGARQLSWSVGLKRAAGITDKTDEEVVAGTDDADELVTMIPTVKFNMLRRMPGVVATVLELAELHGKLAVDQFVGLMCTEYTAAAREALSDRGLVHGRSHRQSVDDFLERHGVN